jgi:acyl-homoserine lactone acylase PvdQ
VVIRVIGDFKGEKGNKYILDVNFTKDGSALAVTDPHLIVRASTE